MAVRSDGDAHVSTILARIVLVVAALVTLASLYCGLKMFVSRRPGPDMGMSAVAFAIAAFYLIRASWCVAAVAAFGTTLAVVSHVPVKPWLIALTVALTPTAALYLYDLL